MRYRDIEAGTTMPPIPTLMWPITCSSTTSVPTNFLWQNRRSFSFILQYPMSKEYRKFKNSHPTLNSKSGSRYSWTNCTASPTGPRKLTGFISRWSFAACSRCGCRPRVLDAQKLHGWCRKFSVLNLSQKGQ